ncbi:MAG TPA: hypothetical protein VFL94_10095 [Actinomycetales bacterium]|nr:hypothetical protein [Actinomycetales bacterium]
MAQMVDANAAWHVRRTVPVDQTQDVGLSVGQTDELTRQIEDNLPQTESVPAGTLQVGTDVTAALVGDPSDVQIRPDQAIDASTGSAVGLLWTWKVRALHPTKDLHLTAHLAMLVPGTDHRLTRDVPLHLTVQRTASYTAHQIFTHWATWAAIVTAAAGVARWLWVRLRRRRAGHATDRDSPDGTAGPTMVSPAAY